MRLGKNVIVKLKKTYSRLAPIDKGKIVFDNIAGRGFGENLKYIAQEIYKRNLKVKMYWLVSDLNVEMPSYIQKVQIGTLRAEYELQTAGFVIYNYRRRWNSPKKKQQVYLQTWHGGVAMKLIEKDAEDKLPDSYINIAKTDGQLTDAILADGEQIEEIYRKSFWLRDSCSILRYGSPRVDALLDDDYVATVYRSVREKLGISKSAYVVLYAPTFRNSGETGCYISDLNKVKQAFSVRYEDVVILVRLHPNVAKTKENLSYQFSKNILNVTDYDDPQELVIASDCGITDYSSIIYDFVMMRKPGFLCMKDVDNYMSERGVYDLFYNQPFKMNYDEETLCNDIVSFDAGEYKLRLQNFFAKYKTYNCGVASKKTVDWLLANGLKTT